MKLFKLNVVLITLSLLNRMTTADWWENGNIYQIYPRSFKDSNGDGIGDLNGITQKLEYLKEIGVTGAWLSPIFQSPMVDFGYDISDYTKVHNEYGTNDDFDKMIAKFKELGIKLILDFVPNHTSDEHEWFQKSIDKDPEYTNFYIWSDGKIVNGQRQPPNNWLSVFRGGAWTWNEKRQQYYLHQFLAKQPDLNYREPKVRDALKNILRLWLDKGVDGFRIDAVPYLYEKQNDDGTWPDAPLSGQCTDDPDNPCYLNTIYSKDLPESIEIIYEWRAFLDNYKIENGGDTRILMTEAYAPIEFLFKLYTNGTVNGSQIPFNFEMFQYIKSDVTASSCKQVIDLWLDNMPKGYQSNWVLGNHDNSRIASRLGGVRRVDLFNILLQTLPGVVITYYGEEIGMTDVPISWKNTIDPQACVTNPQIYKSYSRDPARTPFQWDGTRNAGFSNATKTWLPVATNYILNNVRLQSICSYSHLNVYKALTKLRKTDTFMQGTFKSTVWNENILLFRRELSGNADSYVVVLNFSNRLEIIDLTKIYSTLSQSLQVVTSSEFGYLAGAKVNPKVVFALPQVGTVLRSTT